jgi:hypothetical protein
LAGVFPAFRLFVIGRYLGFYFSFACQQTRHHLLQALFHPGHVAIKIQ